MTEGQNAGVWGEFAANDFKTAEFLMENMHPQPLEIICYHCEQAAEKYLKAYLISCGVASVPRTHDLIELCRLAEEHTPEISQIRRECSSLLPYATQVRYPYGYDLEQSDAQRAISDCHKIMEVIIPMLEPGEEQQVSPTMQ